MNKINYQLQLDEIIKELQGRELKSLLLHSCCAPCSSYVIEYLSKYFNITVFYYNPNIYPHSEYLHRVQEQQRLIKEMNTILPVKFIEGDFDSENYYDVCKGLEKEPEGGKRCEECFKLRLFKTAEKARESGFDYFATTLTISPLKNAQLINSIGHKAEEKYGVNYLAGDFKKRNGYKRSIELSKKFNLYRQNYCGCIFSQNKE